MLGYVRTNTQELRVREHEYYRALYCGLCRRMGKCTGQCSRMTLSYDFVFLAAVRMSLTHEVAKPQKIRCLLHPFRRRGAVLQSQQIDYCADTSALLTYRKLMDDKQDEKGLKRLRAALLRPFLSGAYRKAKKRHPALDKALEEHLKTLSRYENNELSYFGADELAAEFGKLMSVVFSEGLDGINARIAAAIGKAIGHWIYLIDAADDYAEDIKKDRFNPYRKLFEGAPTARDWENLRLALTAQVCEAEKALLLIDGYPNAELREILYNILYLGLPATAERLTARNIAALQKETTA